MKLKNCKNDSVEIVNDSKRKIGKYVNDTYSHLSSLQFLSNHVIVNHVPTFLLEKLKFYLTSGVLHRQCYLKKKKSIKIVLNGREPKANFLRNTF